MGAGWKAAQLDSGFLTPLLPHTLSLSLRFPGWGCHDTVDFIPTPFWNKG